MASQPGAIGTPRESGSSGRDEDRDAEFEFRRYAEFLWNHKWLILASVAVGIVLAVLYTKRQPKVYQAASSVVVDPQAPQVFGTDVQEVVQLGAGNYWSNQEYYNTQVEIIEARSLAEKTLRHFNLQDDPRVVPPTRAQKMTAEERYEYALDVLDGAISASASKESRIIQIRVQHTDPTLARDLANWHREIYQSANLEVRTDKTDDASRFLAKELDSAEKSLRASENALNAFKQDNGLLSVSLEDKMNLIASDLSRYSAAHSEARIKRIELASVRKRAQTISGDVLDSPIFALSENPVVASLKESYVTERQKFLEIEAEFGPKSAKYLEQQKKVDGLHDNLEREAKLALRQIEERYQAAVSAESQFEAEVTRLKTEALELGPKAVEYNRLQRAEEADAQNFKIVQERLRASQLSARNQLGNIEENDAATLPSAPIRPRMMLNVALAGFIFFFLGIGLAFGLEMLDRTVKTGDQVEQAINVPILGPIPLLKEIPSDPNRLAERDLYVYKHPTSRAAECCRSIRTNLLFSGADRALKVMTVTSPNPREGKTTSVIYLGTTFAQSNQRVLLVDTDMRRPRLHKSLGVPRGRGLANLLLHEGTYDDVIKTTEIPNLFVLPCGPTPPNPAELLLTQRFKDILGDLRERFDLILLDSPPMQAVSDAAVLARLSDGVVVVAEAGKTHREALVRSARQLRAVDAHIIGVILNDLDVSDRRYGYYSYYGYGEKSEQTAES
ncbi:MAG: polysaccharide biosynthesis tyrosine autokinase [Myxococcales bacterium]|nr:polysaccharide biosynthesis tyrosine autokinase [Myxococcales bacterium]